MKALIWVIAGVGAGIAALHCAQSTSPVLDRAMMWSTQQTDTLWGSKQRLYGAGSGVAGKVKEGVGRITKTTNNSG